MRAAAVAAQGIASQNETVSEGLKGGGKSWSFVSFVSAFTQGRRTSSNVFVVETGIPMVKAQEGCTHVTAGKSRWSEQPEFAVVTHWRSVDALQAFAGPDWQEAVIEPEEEHMLAEVFCDHYETIDTG